MQAVTLLRRLAEQHEYAALQQSCIELESAAPAVRVLLALAQATLGDRHTARETIEQLDQTALGFAERVDLAATYSALGEVDEASSLLAAIASDTDHHDPSAEALRLARLAWCRVQQGQVQQATELYEQSLQLCPKIGVQLNLISIYLAQGRVVHAAKALHAANGLWQQAKRNWSDDARLRPSRRLRHLALELRLANDDATGAEAWISSLRAELDEDDWCELLCAWAVRLANHDRHPQAEEALRQGLGHYPTNLTLYEQLAKLAQVQGRPLQAGVLLNRGIKLANAQGQPTVRWWLDLSACALPVNAELARHAAEQAQQALQSETGRGPEQSTPGVDLKVQVELALAAVDTQRQHYAAAERRYQRLLAQHPRHAGALQGLGQLLLQLGRIDDAIALFDEVKAIDPTRGYGALISARRFPQDVATLRKLEQLARTPGIYGSVNSPLLLQLAAAWEQREDFEQAVRLADEANSATRLQLRYDKHAHRQQCARIRHAFPKALFEHRRDVGHASTLPVFVVGMPRSGTTLVEQLLAGHSRIHGAGELGTIPRVIAGLERWERHIGSGRHYPDCVDDLDAKVAHGIAGGTLDRRLMRGERGAERLEPPIDVRLDGDDHVVESFVIAQRIEQRRVANRANSRIASGGGRQQRAGIARRSPSPRCRPVSARGPSRKAWCCCSSRSASPGF